MTTSEQPQPGAQRRRPPGRIEDEASFEHWVEAVTARADPFMAWLGVLFALLVGFQLVADVSAGTNAALEWIGWAIWGVFLLELLAKVYVAPSRARFVRRHWIQVLALTLPTLRVLRLFRLTRLSRALPAARVASSSYRTFGTARRLARSRLAFLAGVTSILVVGLAQLVFLFEDREGAFASFGDTLLWSSAVVLGQQADPVPGSIPGRIAMNLGFVLGLTVMAALAATLGAWFVESRRERTVAERMGERSSPPRSR